VHGYENHGFPADSVASELSLGICALSVLTFVTALCLVALSFSLQNKMFNGTNHRKKEVQNESSIELFAGSIMPAPLP
jgi:hypothetical protein